MHPMKPLPQVRWFRGRRLAVVLAAAMLAPGAARADTQSKLPKGYTSDLPELPATGNPDARNVSDDEADEPDDEASDQYADTDASALTEWREPLAPYGTWVVDANYGTVWVPSAGVVGADFAPYVSSGHWELGDDDEWIWVSDYGWGWIPFHYGRWVWISGRGWAWIPGRAYAPAWVVWRVGDGGYIGWAPMPPAWYWAGGVAVTLWAVPPAAYVFCPTVYVFETHVHHHIIHEHRAVQTAAGATRPYKAASPHKPADPKGAGHKGADPGANGGTGGAKPGGDAKSAGGTSGAGHRVTSPSLGDAHVPKSVKPKRSHGDERALSYAHPSTTPRRGPTAARRGAETFSAPTRRGRPSDDGFRKRQPGFDAPKSGREPFTQGGREPFALPEAQPSHPGRSRRDAVPRQPSYQPAPRSTPPARAPRSAPDRDSAHDSAPSARPPAARAPAAPPPRAPSAAPVPRPAPLPTRPAPRRR